MLSKNLKLTTLSISITLMHYGSSEASGNHNLKPTAPEYIQECGSCHTPYPAKSLGLQSWKIIMSGLQKHFGSDASIDNKETETNIENYLLANSHRKETLDSSGQLILRVTETSWFHYEHDEITQSLWQSSDVKAPSNCEACHEGAGEGRFSEHDIRVPNTGTHHKEH